MIIAYVVFFDVDPRLLYAAKVAFDSTYKDPNSNVKALMDCMHTCHEAWARAKCELYARYIAGIQGIMMGKGRLFHTLPKHGTYIFLYLPWQVFRS